MTNLTEITKRAISATTKAKATDLKAVAPRTIEVKKAWIASKVAIHDTVLYFLS